MVGLWKLLHTLEAERAHLTAGEFPGYCGVGGSEAAAARRDVMYGCLQVVPVPERRLRFRTTHFLGAGVLLATADGDRPLPPVVEEPAQGHGPPALLYQHPMWAIAAAWRGPSVQSMKHSRLRKSADGRAPAQWSSLHYHPCRAGSGLEVRSVGKREHSGFRPDENLPKTVRSPGH